jgi:twitching motility protein PilT
MVRADGDALVMHVGERPIVVSGARTIDLSNHGMNLGAMVGMLGQLLSNDAQTTLKEFGAVEHELPSRDPDRFSVVAARSGDDIWIEIRRHRENELVAVAERPALAATAAVSDASDVPAPALASAAVTAEPEVVAETTGGAMAAEANVSQNVPATHDEIEAVAPASSARLPATEESDTRLEPASVPAQSASLALIAPPPNAARFDLSTEESEAATLRQLEALNAPAGEVAVAVAHDPITVGHDISEVELVPAHDVAPSMEAQFAVQPSEPSTPEPPADVSVAIDVPQEVAPTAPPAPVAMADAAVEAAAAALDSPSTVSHSVSALVSGTSMDAARHQGQSPGCPPPAPVVAGQSPEYAAPGAVADSSDSVSSAPVTRTVRIEVPPRAAASRATGIDRLLRAADAVGASELFVVSQARPYVRVGGNVRPLQDESLLLGSDIEALISDVTPEPWRDAVRRGDPAEWLIELADIGRVRCATFRDHRGPGANFHFAFLRAATADELQLSAEIRLLATEPDGLVLVSGAIGSDMSAIVAAFVDLLNQQRADYIITLEPQVRVLHANRQALVSQREVGLEPARAVAAARAALREQPDVLVIESLASGELAQLAIEASRDRLVITSIDAVSSPAAVQRLIELVPVEHRHHAREQLARCFRGAVAQLLLRKSTGGRVAARELLASTRAVAQLLLDGDLARLSDQLEASGATGLASLTDTLVDYVRLGTVDVREAVRKAPEADRLLARLKAAGADISALER